MTKQQKKWVMRAGWLLVLAILGAVAWQKFGAEGKDNGLASGNGRIEAVEIDIAAKSAGRVKDILVREGEFVTAGQVVARIDTETLEAQLRQAEAEQQQALSSVATAQSQLAQRVSEKGAALAVVRQREADLVKARQHSERSDELVKGGSIARQDADDDYAQLQSAEAAVIAARAQVAAADAAVMSVRTQIAGAECGGQVGQGQHRTDPGRHSGLLPEIPTRWPGAVSGGPARRGGRSRRPGVEPG